MTSTETDPRLEGEGGDIATAVGNAPETSGITFTSIEELFTFIIRDILGDDASSIDFYLGKEAIKPSTVDFENLFDLFLKRAELGSPER